MSANVLEIAKAELERLAPDSIRYFDWKKRRQIYQLLNVDSTTTPDPRHMYLTIQSAEFVLPLFRPVDPEDAVVYDLLEEAKAILEGRADDPDQLALLEDEGYHLSDGLGYNFESGLGAAWQLSEILQRRHLSLMQLRLSQTSASQSCTMSFGNGGQRSPCRKHWLIRILSS